MMALGAVLVALGAGGAALGQKAAAGGAAAAQNDGGLSVMPAVIEHGAQPGRLATLTVANRSAAPLAVTVTPRPWVQAATGKVSAEPARDAAPASASTPTKFTLAAGAETQVDGDADLGALRRVPLRRARGRRRCRPTRPPARASCSATGCVGAMRITAGGAASPA